MVSRGADVTGVAVARGTGVGAGVGVGVGVGAGRAPAKVTKKVQARVSEDTHGPDTSQATHA